MLAGATTTSRAIGDPAQGVPTPAPAAPAPATSELPAAQSPKLAALRRVVVVALAPACSLPPVSSLAEPVTKSPSRHHRLLHFFSDAFAAAAAAVARSRI